VFDAATTAKYGVSFLDAMAAGQVGYVASSSTYSSPSGLAATATAQASGSNDPLVEVNIENSTGQPVSQQQRQGPGGQSIIDIVIGQVASNIANGGSVGQTIQSTYGVSRKGVTRG
jgi:hypothetical protein